MQQHDSIITNDLRLGSRSNAVRPSIAFGDGDTGFYEVSDDQIGITLDGGTYTYLFTGNEFGSTVLYAARIKFTTASSTDPAFTFRSDGDTGIGRAAANELSLIAGATEIVRLTTAGLILKVVDAPANAADTGVAGQIAYDGSYFYVCVAANSWTRVAIASW